MIALALSFVFGVAVFVEQPVPGLEVGSRQFPAALAAVNVIAVDVDGDGLKDLVLPSGVWFQQHGSFPPAGQIPLPRDAAGKALHAEGGQLFTYAHRRLSCYSLLAGRWQQEWESSLVFDDADPPAEAALFQDLSGDGRAELILAFRDRLRIFHISSDVSAAGELSVYPPARPQLSPTPNLWAAIPPYTSGVPSLRDFHIVFDGAALFTRESLPFGDGRVEHRFARYTVRRTGEGNFEAALNEERASPPLPGEMFACRFGRASAIGYAGIQTPVPDPLHLGAMVLEVLLAPRPDVAVQSLRTQSALSFVALADFDADGDVDLLTQSNTLENGPPREVLMGLASARTIRHIFFVHVQDGDSRFDPRPRQTLAIDLELGGTALENGPRWQAYRQGLLTCNSADFNGDGRADIAAWIAPDRLGVWLNHEGVFEKKPDCVLKPPAGEGMVPADVDRDGRADLVILPKGGSQAPPVVFFSR